MSTYFSEASFSQDKSSDPAIANIPHRDGYLHIPLAELTERERFLLESVLQEEKPVQQHPWAQFILSENGKLPTKADAVQMLIVEHSQPLSADLQDLLTSLFVNSQTATLSPYQTLLVVEDGAVSAELSQFRDLLPTLENDFGVRLTVFVGNIWKVHNAANLRQLLQAEYALWSAFVAKKGGRDWLTFSQALLWSFRDDVETGAIEQQLREEIQSIADMEETILQLWQTHGNLVQTAQALFIHRNSLQYKLEKFRSQTGLNLKNLDDLAACYLLIL